MNASTEDYWDNIKRASSALKEADFILAGVGSGMTAAGGLSYTDPVLAEKWYPEYFAMGKKSIIEIMCGFWPNAIDESNAAAFWGFWARHILHIRYEPEALRPYLDLFRLIGNKLHFVCSTNVDGQLEKTGFDKNRIYAPQGDYALFQCAVPCCQEVFDNKKQVDAILDNMASLFEVKTNFIPCCPHCGDYLLPNLRCDSNFVEAPHLRNAEIYEQFLSNSHGKKLVLLELGVGFNTPGIIRYPFEMVTMKFPHAHLIRINITNAVVSSGIKNKSISLQVDLGKALNDLLTIA